MSEYIERDAAINEFEIRSSFYDAEWGNKRFTPDDVEEILRSIPAADVQPVRRGRWLRTPTYWAYCSVCGEEPPDETNITTNFCPNCGADMREES